MPESYVRRPACRPLRALLLACVFVTVSGPAAELRSEVRVGSSAVALDTRSLDLEVELSSPLSLASADFDEDGVPDLLVGSSDGQVALYRGNADAIWGYTPEALARKADGAFDDRPFFAKGLLVALAGTPADFLGAGDFDADGHFDVVAAARGGRELVWRPGDGHGSFGLVRRVPVDGVVTSLSVGEVNRPDGLADVIVGVNADDRSTVRVYEWPEGAFGEAPEVIAMPGPVTDIGVGLVDDHWAWDLVVAAGGDLMLVSGRDRRLSTARRSSVAPAAVSQIDLPVGANRLAVGNFLGDSTQDIAVYGGDGGVRILDGSRVAALGGRGGEGGEGAHWRDVGFLPGPEPQIFAANMTRTGLSDLVVASPVGGRLLGESGSLELGALDGPAAIALRLNRHAAPGLVAIDAGGELIRIEQVSGIALTVNSTGDDPDLSPGDGACDVGAAECSLRAAIEEANALAGLQTIEFSIPGAGVHTIQPLTALPTITDAVTIDGYTQPGAAQATGPGPATLLIEIDGSLISASHGLVISGGSSTIRGLTINRLPTGGHHGLYLLSDGHIVEGNHLGTDPAGTTGLGNVGAGARIDGDANTIGGTTDAARNVISGNANTGLQIWFTGEGNFVQGNYIGIAADGTGPLGNGGGVATFGGSNQTIGGISPGSGNVISNPGKGIDVAQTVGPLLIQGNLIGTDATGNTGLLIDGVGIQDGISGGVASSLITVGGTSPTARNVISGLNGGVVADNFPIGFDGSDWLIQGNYIGVGADGTVALPSKGPGIVVGRLAGPATIGGTVAGAANIIAFNGIFNDPGVKLFGITGDSPHQISVLGNSIFSNSKLGIEACFNSLCSGVPTANDPLDGDTGPNGLQNYPTLSAVDAETGLITGALGSTPSTTYRVEYFGNDACDASGYGEGEVFLGFDDSVTTSASGDAILASSISALLAGLEITATATDPDGNTSEFSECVTATGEADVQVTKDDGETDVTPGQAITYTIAVSNPTGPAGVANVAVSDVVPSDLIDCSWTCSSGGGAGCEPGPVLGSIVDEIDLPVGGTATYSLSCTVDPAATAGPLANTASLTLPASVTDPDTNNNTATDTDTIIFNDYGDAPDPTYPTLLASNGARHGIVSGFHLGASIDDEADGQPTAAADGDDLDGNDDEDGVAFGPLLAGDTAAVDVTASGAGLLNGWIDFNADGDWTDPGEQVFTDQALASGLNALSASVPLDATLGLTAARFRFDSTGGLAPTGPAVDGEVEDYIVLIEAEADLSIAIADSPDPVVAGEQLVYTITVGNAGPSNALGVMVTNAVPAGTSLVATAGCQEDPSGAPTCSLGTLAPGADAMYTLTVLVDPTATGSVMDTGVVSSSTTDPAGANNTAAQTTTVVAETDLEVSTTDSADPLMAGEDLTYTIEVTNVGPSASTGSTLTVNLPVEVIFLSSVPGAPDCVEDSGVVTCSVAPLAVSAIAQVEILVNVPLGVEAIIANTSQIVAAETDPNSANDIDIEETEILESLVIFVDGFESGDTSAWSQVVN